MRKARSRRAHNKNKRLIAGRFVTDLQRTAKAWTAVLMFTTVVAGGTYQQTLQDQPLIDPKVVINQVRAQEVVEPEKRVEVLYSGKVSYYSHDGCLGCGESQTMGNGQPFDENAMTLAVPCEDIISKKYRYGTKVRVVNQDTNQVQDATITDCGGFSKYNRVADLSKGLYEKIQAKTDVSNIMIYQVK